MAMTERTTLPAPRRYITRARAQADADAPSIAAAAPATRNRAPSVPAKRKALGEAAANIENAGFGPTTRATRAAKKPATESVLRSSGLNAAPRRRPTRATAANTTAAPTTSRKITASLRASKILKVAPPSDKENAAPEQQQQQQQQTAPQAKPKKVVKKVHFVSPVVSRTEPPVPVLSATEETKSLPAEAEGETEDVKENVPAKKASQPQGALAARPKRVRSSKIPPPSNSDEALAKIPALSPMKAKRIGRPAGQKKVKNEDENSPDEALCPVSPGLSRKPKRLPGLKKDAMEGAGLLQQKPAQTSVLYGSPARRIAPSPIKMRAAENSSVSPVKTTGLSSPAKRPLGASAMKKSAMKASSLKFSIASNDEDDPFTIAEDPSDDELNLSSKQVDRRLFFKKQSTTDHSQSSSAALSMDAIFPDLKQKLDSIQIHSDVVPADPTTPPSEPTSENTMAFKDLFPPASHEVDLIVHVDDDGDSPMSGREYIAPTFPSYSAPILTHRSPSRGGSSFGLFDSSDEDSSDLSDFENDNDNAENIAPSTVRNITNQLSVIELERSDAPRSFGQSLEIGEYGFAIDPALLGGEEEEEDTENLIYTDRDVLSQAYQQLDTIPSLPPPTITAVPLKPAHEFSPVQTPRSRRSSGILSPASTPGPLSSATIFLDIHTESGADASEHFSEVLRGLGARVLKQWSWNPALSSPSNCGITHVVFKEGSPRTLQKVKETNGRVKCVGLRWVQQCDATQSWVDEDSDDYLVDLDVIPRGGAKRRKSMEPRPMEPLGVKTPEKVTDKSTMALGCRTEPRAAMLGGMTPMQKMLQDRLAAARRKSMQFAPKIGSPLAKGSWTMNH